MKRICAFLVMFAGIWMLLTTSAHAQAVDAALDDTLTDHLATGEDVKWYRFEMSEPGDAELVIHGLQERWDGWNSHWAAKIYGPDLQTVLAEGTARGYNGNQYSPPARFSLLALDSGTYYIRITAAGTNHFTTDSYRLELNRTYRSAQPYVDSSDGNLYVIGTESFMDRLISQDQVRWYVFEMTEPGDAVLTVTGLQDRWDGYAYHWQCAIYEADRQTVIVGTNVRGYSKTDGPSVLSASELAAGTYYVRMTSTSSSNPLMTTFITDPYQMQLVRNYSSVSAVSDAGNEVKVSQKPGEQAEQSEPVESGEQAEQGESGGQGEPEATKQPEKAEHGDVEAWLETKQDAAALCAVGGVSLFVALCLFNGLCGPSKRKRSRRPSSSSGSSSGSYSSPSSSSGYSSGSYSSSGYSSSFEKPASERSFTEGGPTGCGIGGSFCGCGSGR